MAELTKSDWIKLYKNGLITARGIENWDDNEFKELNGHVSTTELADEMFISRNRDCNLHIGRSVYSVRYYSGCFYPMWSKNENDKNENDNHYKLNLKTNKIEILA